MTDTYSHLDSIADVRTALDWQDRVDAWPDVRAYKAWSYEGTGDLRPLLDVGCGPGNDLAALGPSCIGVDRSAAMAARAASRGGTVTIGDGAALPFAASTFGAARADRVLQHLADPFIALREMIRVTRPGGRVIVVDPDQETLVIHVPGVHVELVDRVKAMRRDVGYRNGRLASSLPDGFRSEGLGDVSVRAFPLVLTDPDDAFGLPGWVAYWRERGHPFDESDVREWEAGTTRAREGGFVYALLYFVVTGAVA